MNLNLKLHWENSPAPIGVKGVNKIEVSLPLGAMIIDPIYVSGDVTKAYVDEGNATVKAYADAQLATKANLTNLVQLEADLQYDLSQKADSSALLLKADKTELDDKASVAYVDAVEDSVLASVTSSLDSKADVVDVDNMFDSLVLDIEGKADVSYVNSSVALAVADKIDKAYVDTQDAEVLNLLSTKAEVSYVDATAGDVIDYLTPLIQVKADKTYVDSQNAILSTNISSRTTKAYVDQQDNILSGRIDLKADASSVNQLLSTKADLVNGRVPESQLPSFVDDVLSYDGMSEFPTVGEDGKIYIDKNTNKTYRWTGSVYAALGSGDLVLGETSATAYRGDRGKAAYDHSLSTGNPHNTNTSEIVEGTNFYFTEPRVRMTPMTGINITNTAQVGATDFLITAMGKLQAQVNTKTSLTLGTTSTTAMAGNSTTDNIQEGSSQLYFTQARARSSYLSGIVFTNSTNVTNTDTIVQGIGKLQAQITASGGGATSPTWVNITAVGTVAPYVTPVDIQVARFQGMLWIRGTFNVNTSVAVNSELFRITSQVYKPYAYSTSGSARLLQIVSCWNTSATVAKQFSVVALGNITNSTQASTVEVVLEAKTALAVGDRTMNIPPTIIGTLAVP